MKIVNKEHPQWIAYWNSPIEFIKPTPELNKHWLEIEEVLLEWPDYKCAWLFIDAQGSEYIVAKENGRYGTHIIGWHCGDVGMYDTLEEAAQATFADWFPEDAVGQWNDAGNEYTTDGQWLIKQS